MSALLRACQARLAPHSTRGSGYMKDDMRMDCAYVHRYLLVPADLPIAIGDLVLGCPVFGIWLAANDHESSICLVEHLLPCKLVAMLCAYKLERGTRNQVKNVS